MFRFRPPPRPRFHLLIVCTANITRSPYIAARLRREIQLRWPTEAPAIAVSSAGVAAKPDHGPDAVMRVLAYEKGISLIGHRSQPLSPALVQAADLILTMEAEQAAWIWQRFRGSETKTIPLPNFGRLPWMDGFGDIEDPTGRDAPAYEAFADRAELEVLRILELLEGELLGTKSNLVLIGMPGAGKSTLGELLARQLQRPFVDTDRLLEQELGQSLQEVVDTRGHLALRALEAELALRLNLQGAIIATGGSMVYSREAMLALRRIGRIVYLDVPLPAIQARIGSGEGRGLARPDGQTLADLFAEREPLYRLWAERIVRADLPIPEAILPALQQCW